MLDRRQLEEILLNHRGTLTFTSVHPREVARKAVQCNAANVVCGHNHPGGSPTPSECDLRITEVLRSALALLDVRLIDHIVIAGSNAVSTAECGAI